MFSSTQSMAKAWMLSMPLPQSAVPHLARSLFAKRASCQSEARIVVATSGAAGSASRDLSLSSRRHASTVSSRLPSSPARRHPVQRRAAAPVEEFAPPSRPPRPFSTYFMGVSMFGFILATYISYNYVKYVQDVARYAKIDLPQDADVSGRWKDLTRDYDDEVDLSEKLMLLKWKRKRLVSEASGDVLEVSVGTGRNMDLYDLRPYDERENESTGRSRRRIIRSFTFNDQSEVMAAQAERKFEEMQARRSQIERFRGKVDFVVGDAGIKGVIQRPDGGFDTIVQTMGVCSMADPVSFLRRLGELCRQPGEVKPGRVSAGDDKDGDDGDNNDNMGGKILLLEHGRSYYDWLNRVLDDGAKMHADHYGCWWNKDVGRIVKESGLVVERIKRYYFGTTWEIVLRPAPKDKK